MSAPTAANTPNKEHTATAIFNALAEAIYFAANILSIIGIAALARAAPNMTDDLVRWICHGSIPQNQPSLSVALIELISTASIWILILKLLLNRLAQLGGAAKDTRDSFRWLLLRSRKRVSEIGTLHTAGPKNVIVFPSRTTQPV